MKDINFLSQQTGISPRTIQSWAKGGRLPYIYRAGRVYIFDDAAIDVITALRAKHKGKKGAAANA